MGTIFYICSDISDYIIQSEIGHGTFSNVYLGTTEDQRDVVLKVLKKSLPNSINREIQVLNHLRGKSPHIVQLIDAIRNTTTVQNATLVFEYLAQTTLDKKGYKNQYKLTEIRTYMR
jgi:serine/threonine protein kinase